jgi:hypothetical protein
MQQRFTRVQMIAEQLTPQKSRLAKKKPAKVAEEY